MNSTLSFRKQHFLIVQVEAVMINYKSESEQKTLSTAEYFVCGACAGFAGSFVEGPIDLVGRTKIKSSFLDTRQR